MLVSPPYTMHHVFKFGFPRIISENRCCPVEGKAQKYNIGWPEVEHALG